MSITTQIDYVVTGLQNLTTAVSKLGEISSAQLALQKSTNDLTRSLSMAATSGFDSLTAALTKTSVANKEAVSSTNANIASVKALASANANTTLTVAALTEAITASSVAASRNLSYVNSLTSALASHNSALLTTVMATEANVAASNQQLSSFSKLAAMEGEIVNLKSGSTAILAQEIALKEADVLVTRQLQGVSAAYLAEIQLLTISESALTREQSDRVLTQLGLIKSNQQLTTSEAARTASLTAASEAYSKVGRDQELAIAMNKLYTAERAKVVAIEAQALTGIKNATSATSAYTATQRDLHSVLRGVGAATNSLMLTYGSIIPMVLSFVTAITAIKTVKIGAEFDSMARYIEAIQSKASGAVMGLEDIKSSILAIKGVSKTPAELAEGVTMLVKAGLPAAEAIENVAYMAKFATVTQTDMAAASSLVTSQWAAWGPASNAAGRGVESMTELMDILAIAVNESRADVEDLQQSVKYLSSLSGTTQATYTDLVALAAALSNLGLEGSIGATAVRTSLQRLKATASDLSKTFMEDFGVIFDPFVDASKTKLKEGSDMLLAFFQAVDQLAPEARSQMILTGLGFRGMATQAVVSGDEMSKGFTTISKTIEDGVKASRMQLGYVGTAFEKLSKDTLVQMAELKSGLQRAMAEAFNTEAAQDALENLIDLVNSGDFKTVITGLADAFWLFSKASAGLAAVIAPLASRFTDLKEAYYDLKAVFTEKWSISNNPIAAAVGFSTGIVWGVPKDILNSLDEWGEVATDSGAVGKDLALAGSEVAKGLTEGGEEIREGATRTSTDMIDAANAVRDAYKGLSDIYYKLIPEGLSKDTMAIDLDMSDMIQSATEYANALGKTPAEIDSIIAKIKEWGAEQKTNIRSEAISTYSATLEQLTGTLGDLTSEISGVSELEAGVYDINSGFADLKTSIQASADALKDETDPALVKIRESFIALLAETKKMQPAVTEAFETKVIDDFNKSLEDLNKSYEKQTKYEEVISGIKDAYTEQREEVDRLFKGTTEYDQKLKEVNESEQKVIATSREAAIASEDLWSGFVAGAQNAQDELQTLGELGAEIAVELRDGFKEVFVDVIKGDIDNIESTIKEALGGIGDTVIDYIAEGLANKTMDALVEGLSSFAPEISGLLEGFTERGSASNPSYVYVTNMPAGGLGTAGWDSASASALSSGVGTDASWFAGNTADSYGVNDGTVLALKEGTYQIAAGKAAATWVDTFSAGVKTAAGYAGTALGAYGVYSGVKQMMEGNVGGGAIQTGISAYGTYQSAITAGIIEKGAATEFAKSIAAAFAKEKVVEVGGAKVVEAAAAKGTGAGIGAGAGWAAALPAIAYLLNNIGGETPTVSPSDSMNALGMTPEDLAAFSSGWKNISNSVLDLDTSLEQFGVGMQTIGEATYSAEESMLYYTSGLGIMASAFDESTNTWSEAAVGMKLDATQLGASATAASSATVSAAAAIMSSYTGTSTSMNDAATIANAAANAYQDLAVSESGSTTYAIELQRTLEAMGLSSSQAAAAAQDLISQLESEANASSNVSEVSAGAASSLGGFATAITESAASAATAAVSVSSSMSSLTSTLGGFAVAAGSTADSLRKAVGSWDEAVSTGSRAMGGPIGEVVGFANGGLLKGGTGARDDLYLGTIGGTRYMAMGGEMVMNRRATRENYATLDAMNKGTNESSGPTVIHNHFYVDGKEIASTIMPAVDKQVTAQARRGALTKRTAY